jgi:hypothetical protein
MFLTQRQQAVSVNPTDYIHIVNTASTVTNAAGDSFKAQISQIFELTSDCCLTAGTVSDGTLTFINSSGNVAFSVSGFNFTGGSGNCINQLYVNEIYPCVTNIRIQPLSSGNTYFGIFSGFTVDHTSDPGSTRIGLNTETPEHTFDFFSYDGRSRFYYDENANGLHTVTLLGDDTIVAGVGAFSEGGSAGLILNVRGNNNTTYEKIGAQGDTCLYSSTNARGLNIITQYAVGAGPFPEYIRFYAGTDVQASNENPHIHIDGDGANQGFMGIGQGNVDPTSLVDISGATGYNQLRLRTPYNPSGSADTNGEEGDICWGINASSVPYIYVKTGSGWRRAQLSVIP